MGDSSRCSCLSMPRALTLFSVSARFWVYYRRSRRSACFSASGVSMSQMISGILDGTRSAG